MNAYKDTYIHTHISWVYTYLHTQGYYGQSGFIAAQAPLKNTIEDTWNVIREQNCSVVVVLCNLVEEEQVEEMVCMRKVEAIQTPTTLCTH